MKCRTHLLCVTQWQSSSDLNKRIYVTDAITAFSCGFFPSSKIFWIIPGMYLNFYLRCGTNVTRNAYCLVNLIFYRIVVIKLNSSAAVTASCQIKTYVQWKPVKCCTVQGRPHTAVWISLKGNTYVLSIPPSGEGTNFTPWKINSTLSVLFVCPTGRQIFGWRIRAALNEQSLAGWN